jgi:hypothetical protein
MSGLMSQIGINHDADGSFASLADETWLAVTDDYAVPDAIEAVVEPYFRLGMLAAFQLVVLASADSDSEASQRVRAAIAVAAELLR